MYGIYIVKGSSFIFYFIFYYEIQHMNKEYKGICMYSLKNTHTYKLTNQSREHQHIPQEFLYIPPKLHLSSSLKGILIFMENISLVVIRFVRNYSSSLLQATW